MKTGLFLLAALALAGCEMTAPATETKPDGDSAALVASERPIGNISAGAKAEMDRRGLPLSILIRDKKGCYGLVVEVTTPQTGVPLNGADGKQICD